MELGFCWNRVEEMKVNKEESEGAEFGDVCFFYLMVNKKVFELNAK